MALKKPMVVRNNFGQPTEFQSTYSKVENIVGNKEQIVCVINVRNEKDGMILITHQYSFVPNLQGKNFIAQAYDYAKTTPEFAGAQDC